MTAKVSAMSAPKTLSQRVRDSEQRRISSGARRIPGGILPADAAQALDALRAAGYESSYARVIARAIIEAHRQAAAS